MARTLLCKLLQRKTYDILSRKHTFLFLIFGCIILLISILHFGETMLEWSKEKYSVVFSPYSNNIVGKNFRSMLCQYVPIDVVYTWVNGSDPKFLKELSKAKNEYGFSSSHLNCTFSHCVKSHMVIVKPALPSSITLGDLEEHEAAFEHIEKLFVVSSSQGNFENVTVLAFTDVKLAEQVIQMRFMNFDGQNYTFFNAYVTDNWNSPNTVLLSNVFMMTNVPSGFTEEQIKNKFPEKIMQAITKVHMYEEKSLALLSLKDTTVLSFVRKMNNITFSNKVATISSTYLVVELPSDHEDISASRFTDNEELRYSLRSLEKHAPWVQHVYIITNGQIPYWLNLDNPLVSIITHEEIFPNKSHLPTFSSPAIECHIHRIPNLSKKFLYLNDDVMFGKDVWPEDFFTHTKGQKVYLSWPVPNCAEGCPSSWIRDGYCDKPCNNSQCQWDGGDCTADNPMLSYHGPGSQQEGAITSFFNFRTNKNYCNDDCANTWLADRYCDKACNTFSCGFDAGDCGLENFNKMHMLVLMYNQSTYVLPQGEYIGYFNLTDFIKSNYTITEGYYEESYVIRTIAISLKYSVISIVLYPNQNSTNITITLKGEFNNNNKKFEKLFYLSVSTLPKPTHVENKNNSLIETTTIEAFTFEEFPDSVKSPKILIQNVKDTDYPTFGNVNMTASKFPENILKEVEQLKNDFDMGLITYKGFLKKKDSIIRSYMNSSNNMNISLIFKGKPVNMSINTNDSHIFKNNSLSPNNAILTTKNVESSSIKLLLSTYTLEKPIPPYQVTDLPHSLKKRFVPYQKHVADTFSSPSSPLRQYFKNLSNSLKKVTKVSKSPLLSPSVTQRHLLDTFGDSLRHVNKLYNEAFGYEARKVPSHIAHFVDKSVMSRLTERFSAAFDVTSSHKIRSSNDMQFAFSYYYFLMSEMESVEVDEIFDMFDTDNSGTWSDREIRTVLTRLHDLPLDFSSVTDFEQHIINCSFTHSASSEEIPTPYNERYFDSKLPLVTKSLVCSCETIVNMLLHHFGQRKKNGFEIVGEEEVAFKMIHNNLSQVLGQIDDLRKHPKKICLLE